MASTMNTAGRLKTPPSSGDLAIASGSGDPERGVEERVEVAAPADRDRGDRDAVLQDQVPADDPGDDLAERGVGVGVRAAGHRDRRRQLGVRQRGEHAGDRGQHERQDDRRTGDAGALADHHEDAGADDGADTHRGQLGRADARLSSCPVSCVLATVKRRRGSRRCPACVLSWPAVLLGESHRRTSGSQPEAYASGALRNADSPDSARGFNERVKEPSEAAQVVPAEPARWRRAVLVLGGLEPTADPDGLIYGMIVATVVIVAQSRYDVSLRRFLVTTAATAVVY